MHTLQGFFIMNKWQQIKYAIRKKKYIKARDELLARYCAMPQPISTELVDKMNNEKKELMNDYRI